MGKRIIVVGDKTDHNGVVITGSPTHAIDGKPIARLGDMVDCPKDSHGKNKIIEGHPTFTVDGIPVALEGHKTECGCVLIGSMGPTVGD